MVAERKVYEEEGVEKYVAFQVENENEPLKPGAAFPFVKVGERCVSEVSPPPPFSEPLPTKHVPTSPPSRRWLPVALTYFEVFRVKRLLYCSYKAL